MILCIEKKYSVAKHQSEYASNKKPRDIACSDFEINNFDDCVLLTPDESNGKA